jgi:hypothetical protein
MTRYYENPTDGERTRGNVVLAIRDTGAERLPERERYLRAVSDYELCNYVEGLYLEAHIDHIREHPERRKMEVRCLNRDEAEYLRALINERCGDPKHRFVVTYPR